MWDEGEVMKQVETSKRSIKCVNEDAEECDAI